MKNTISRILSAILTLIYLATATLKFIGVKTQVAEFALFGYPPWFLYVVAVLEAVCAVGLQVPRFARGAALLLVCDMVGAAFSHLTHHQAKMAAVPIVLLILLIAVISLNSGRKQLMRTK